MRNGQCFPFPAPSSGHQKLCVSFPGRGNGISGGDAIPGTPGHRQGEVRYVLVIFAQASSGSGSHNAQHSALDGISRVYIPYSESILTHNLRNGFFVIFIMTLYKVFPD